MPITQKRIYEVSLPETLKRLISLEAYTVSDLKSLQQAILDFGNEISDALGAFNPPKPTTTVTKSKVTPKGSPLERQQIFTLLKQKSMTSRDIIAATGMEPQTVYNIMHYLFNNGYVERVQNPDNKMREFIFSLKPSGISVA